MVTALLTHFIKAVIISFIQYHQRSCSETLLLHLYEMLNKNTWGVKKYEANQKQHARRQVRPKALISAKAKKLLYHKTFNSLNDIQ